MPLRPGHLHAVQRGLRDRPQPHGPLLWGRIKNGGEECDNSKSFACGTCGQQGTTDACKDFALQRATGTITVASTAVADGESFTIDDGINDPVTFEMDTNSSCQQTAVHKCVTVSGTSTTATIAASIQTAIAGASSSISSSVAGGGSQVSLSNTAAGINGNVAIQTSGSSGAIVVEGMTGGVGCPVGSLCQSRTDCVSNTCRSGTCKP